MNKRERGSHYEALAAKFLKERGYEILERNYRCRMGEIDIICKDDKYLVFVEVKYRSGSGQGGAFMAVDHKKQHRISRVAAYYLLEHQMDEGTPCRFDVVAVRGDAVQLVKNAFEYSG